MIQYVKDFFFDDNFKISQINQHSSDWINLFTSHIIASIMTCLTFPFTVTSTAMENDLCACKYNQWSQHFLDCSISARAKGRLYCPLRACEVQLMRNFIVLLHYIAPCLPL